MVKPIIVAASLL